MAVTLPPELTRLDPDTRDAAIALAVEILREPQPIEGLTWQQSKMVHVLQAAGGRWVTYDAWAYGAAIDPLNPPTSKSILSQLRSMRGHPVRRMIETTGRGGRGKKGMARWTE